MARHVPEKEAMRRRGRVFYFIALYKSKHGGDSPTFAEMREALGKGNDALYVVLDWLMDNGFLERIGVNQSSRGWHIPGSAWLLGKEMEERATNVFFSRG